MMGTVDLSADATSVKMDYLPIGHARVDPILREDCPSDHVHTFYGPQSGVDPRRVDVADELELHSRLINTTVSENTGNVEENKSVYWHPTVYKYDRTTNTYTRDVMAQTSVYYVWETGATRAFPNGFQMIGGFDPFQSEATAECVGESPCDEDDCYTENTFFPTTKCAELEVSMRMPNCWDGVSVNSPPDHVGHVAYADHNLPGAECPASHPISIPQINMFFRIMPYDGGWHTFSDGSGVFHADYVSGWDEVFLQNVLDGCENEGEGAMPNHFCEDFLTFRDAPKCTDESTCDFADPQLLEKVHAFQPSPLDVKGSIIAEETEVVVGSLPRGTCNGSLIDASPTTQSNQPSKAPTQSPSSQPTNVPSNNPTNVQSDPTNAPTHNPTSVPTYTPTNNPTNSGQLARVHVLTDRYPGETEWTVSDKVSGSLIASGGPYDTPFKLYKKEFGVTAGNCYEFAITDTYGDGICCSVGDGKYEVFLDGTLGLVMSGGTFGKDETKSFGDCGTNSGQSAKIHITTDSYPGETEWTVRDKARGALIASGGPYGTPYKLYDKEFSVTAGVCYEFAITDTYGDGICCSVGDGKYEIFLDSTPGPVVSGGTFGESDTKLFGDCGGGLGKLQINIKTDYYPGDTSWKLMQLFPPVEIATGGGWPAGGAYTMQNSVYSTPPIDVESDGCFEFAINDSYGDGIPGGYYEVVLDGVTVLKGGGPGMGSGNIQKFNNCS